MKKVGTILIIVLLICAVTESSFCEELAKKGEVMVYEHSGFWECVDTERDLNYLNKLWNQNKATWKVWNPS